MKEERSLSQSSLPAIDHMFDTINNKHSQWGLEFYRVTPKYFDPKKERGAKENQSSVKIKHGKRQHFLDEIAKQNCTPGPSKYNNSLDWRWGGKLKNPRVLEDRTYIEQIFFDQKKFKNPAPNAYNVLPTAKQTEAKLKQMKERKAQSGSDRLSFLNTAEYQSLRSPGPGSYNPHQTMSYFKENHFTPQQIKKKHEQEKKREKEKRSASKSPNREPIFPRTFQERALLPKYFQQNQTNSYKKDPKQKKPLSKSTYNFPAPNHYNVTQDWKSKSGIFKSLSNVKQNLSVYR